MRLGRANSIESASSRPPCRLHNHGWRSSADLLSLFVLLLCAITCDNDSAWRPTPGLSGYARLENQSEHSGVLLTVTDLDSIAVTDSTGFFSFSGIPDGRWKLVAIYPFFGRDTTEIGLVDGVLEEPIDITLPQLLQFWVEPAETTVSMSNSPWGDQYFPMELWGYLENISDRVVRTGCLRTPRGLFAIRPMESTYTKDCDRWYGWLCPTDAYDDFWFTFEPGEKRAFLLGVGYRFYKPCFAPGRYEFYWCINDNYYYGRHFECYSALNRSLIDKRELLRPAALTLVE